MDGFATIAQTLQATGPYGLAAIFVALYLRERAYSQALNGKILEIAIKSTEAAMAQTSAIGSLKEVLLAMRGNE